MGAAFFFTTLLDTSPWPIHILSVYWTWGLKQFRQLRSFTDGRTPSYLTFWPLWGSDRKPTCFCTPHNSMKLLNASCAGTTQYWTVLHRYWSPPFFDRTWYPRVYSSYFLPVALKEPAFLSLCASISNQSVELILQRGWIIASDCNCITRLLNIYGWVVWQGSRYVWESAITLDY